MDPLPLNSVARACGGELLGSSPDAWARRLCTDSRQARAGDLFFALKGERFDAHEFIPEVANRGVSGVVVHEVASVRAQLPCAVIRVDDTRSALGRLAAFYRWRFDLPIVAVAGSNGKTTTKELLAAVLRERFSTLHSPASFNNEIGVPLTLLQLECNHQAAVLEVGTNHPGELAPLVRMIQPRYGIITSIGREHLEFFGDIRSVANEEGTLAELLPSNGKLFINGDTAEVDTIAARSSAPVVRAGLGAQNDWRATKIQLSPDGVGFEVTAPMPGYDGAYSLSLIGRHQVVNALLAMAAAAELGLTAEEIRRGLATCPPAKMRLQLFNYRDVQVLDDAYNANADSMSAALETLQDFPCRGRRVAVLGDMSELGIHAAAAHAEVGRLAARLGVSQLFAVGQMAGVMGGAAREAGLRAVQEFFDVDAAGKAVRAFVAPGDVVLLKASRATRLERVGELLRSGGVDS